MKEAVLQQEEIQSVLAQNCDEAVRVHDQIGDEVRQR